MAASLARSMLSSLLSPISYVSSCLAGYLRCRCSVLGPCSILLPSSAGPSLTARGCFWLGAGNVLLSDPSCPLPMSCIPGAAAALLQHGRSERTRGLTPHTISGFRVS